MEIILTDLEKEKFSLEVIETVNGFSITLVEKKEKTRRDYEDFYKNDMFTTVWRKPDGSIVEKQTIHMPSEKSTGRDLKPGDTNSYDWVCQMIYQSRCIDIKYLEVFGND